MTSGMDKIEETVELMELREILLRFMCASSRQKFITGFTKPTKKWLKENEIACKVWDLKPTFGDLLRIDNKINGI